MEPGLYHMDCMEALRSFPDKFFDLAIVDPPYGGGAVCGDPGNLTGGGQPTGSSGRVDAGAKGLTATISAARTGGTWAAKYGQKGGVFDDADVRHWDVAPPPEYFRELARVSKDQVIWGGNYFDLPPTRCFLVWDKCMSENFSMAMCEYAWTSFNGNAKIFKCTPQGTAKEPRFHPTQKPVQLYTWILRRYAKPGMKVLDTHAGSASCLVACHRAGLDCWGYEIDAEYYRMAKARLDKECAQVNIFDALEGT